MVVRADLGLTRGRLAHVRKRASTARALCGEEAQQASLPRACVTPRGFELALRLQKATALATGLSRSVQGRGGTRRPCSRARLTCACAQEKNATACALCGEEAQHVRLPRACATPRGIKLVLRLKKAAALATRLSRSVQDRGGTRRPWSRARPTCACAQEKDATARALCGEEAQQTRSPRARATPRGFKLTLRL